MREDVIEEQSNRNGKFRSGKNVGGRNARERFEDGLIAWAECCESRIIFHERQESALSQKAQGEALKEVGGCYRKCKERREEIEGVRERGIVLG
jgi:hypothetical protein